MSARHAGLARFLADFHAYVHAPRSARRVLASGRIPPRSPRSTQPIHEDTTMTKQNADIITLNGNTYPADVVARYMDDNLREEMHFEDWESEQDFVDAYAVRHAERFGEPFVIN